MPVIELTEADERRVEEFAGRLFGACLATLVAVSAASFERRDIAAAA